MIDDLRDPSKANLHPAVRRGLRDLGLPAVNPLLAATEMKDEPVLMTVVTVLGDLGYDTAVPYLARLARDPATPSDVKDASTTPCGTCGWPTRPCSARPTSSTTWPRSSTTTTPPSASTSSCRSAGSSTGPTTRG